MKENTVTRGLIIREPWVSLLASGKKTWEMRARATALRGRIALIRGGSGLIIGEATLVECLSARTKTQMRANIARHQVPASEIEACIARGWSIPWVFADAVLYRKPKPYKHPSGAVTWVRLD